jgi:lysophospholipase L1-like esterase
MQKGGGMMQEAENQGQVADRLQVTQTTHTKRASANAAAVQCRMPVRSSRVFVLGSLCFVLLFLATISPNAVTAQAALPSSMAAAGDSLTKATGAGERYFDDYAAFSWATGSAGAVNSLALRIATANPALSGNVYNMAEFGAQVYDLRAQIATINAVQVEFVTVMVGGNDACMLTEAAMTAPDVFEQQFADAMQLLADGSPNARVLVMSIPDPIKLWEIYRNEPRARFIWSVLDICQTALARPLSDSAEDNARRERVRQRVADYNARMAAVCARYPQCRSDGGAVFAAPLAREDITTADYFHLSARGQARLADLAWSVSGLAP